MTTLHCSFCKQPYESEYPIPDELVADMISLCPSCERAEYIQRGSSTGLLYAMLRHEIDQVPAKGISIPIPDEMLGRIENGETITLTYHTALDGWVENFDPDSVLIEKEPPK
jgi:hypothetical protein